MYSNNTYYLNLLFQLCSFYDVKNDVLLTLNITKMNEIRERVKNIFINLPYHHNYEHIERVVKHAKEACKYEGLTDKQCEIVEYATLLHDIDDYKLFPPGVNSEILSLIPDDIKEEVIECKDLVGHYGKKQEKSYESWKYIPSDADKLDALGVIGFYRCFTYSEENKRKLHNGFIPTSLEDLDPKKYESRYIDYINGKKSESMVDHYLDKLIHLQPRSMSKYFIPLFEKALLDIKLYLINFLHTYMENIFDKHPEIKEPRDVYGIQVSVVEVSPCVYPAGKSPAYLIANAARNSFSKFETNRPYELDKKLINYLYKNHHTSPLEFASITFKIKCPKYVAIQILRHRTGKFNEESQRYTEIKESFLRPSLCPDMFLRQKHDTNKQGSRNGYTQEALDKVIEIENKCDEIINMYHELIQLGVANECARFCLPVSLFTTLICQFDLNNLIKFLKLRTDPHAQYETRIVANMMKDYMDKIFPELKFDNNI